MVDMLSHELGDLVRTISPSLVVHFGMVSGRHQAREDPGSAMWNTVAGTTAILRTLLASPDAVRFVYISSATVYGVGSGTALRESDRLGPTDAYGLAKMSGELVASQFGRDYDVDVVVVRPCGAYGMGDRSDRLLSALVGCAVQGATFELRVPLDERVDFTAVDDVVRGIVLASTSTMATGGVFNISRGEARSVGDAVEILGAAGFPVRVRDRSAGSGVHRAPLDITNARHRLGYEPTTPLEVGLPAFAVDLSNALA